jgi:hypothetical protein
VGYAVFYAPFSYASKNGATATASDKDLASLNVLKEPQFDKFAYEREDLGQ